MALRPAPKKKLVDYQKVDALQKEIFGLEQESETSLPSESDSSAQTHPKAKNQPAKSAAKKSPAGNADSNLAPKQNAGGNSPSNNQNYDDEPGIETNDAPGKNLSDLETIAEHIVSSKAGQGRSTTRPFSLPRTLIIDTTRLKSKFRTIDEQFTQNVIVDFLLREALAGLTPENYKDLRSEAFEYVKRPDETTRRSLTVTEEVVYQMSELKAGINLLTGKKYSNDEIFSTSLAIGVSWLYRSGVLS